MATKTEKAIRGILEESIAGEVETIRVHDAIARIISAKFEGKQVTKRLATLLRAEMQWPETCVVAWDTEHGTGKVRVWGKGTPWLDYNASATFYVGHTGWLMGPNELASMTRDVFEKCDNANGGAAKARNARRETLLANRGHLAKLALEFDAYVEATKAFKASLAVWIDGSPRFDDNYTIEKLAEQAIKA